MSELQTVREKIQGDFFLEKSYKEYSSDKYEISNYCKRKNNIYK